jgi:hypothetical protein
MSNHWYYDIDGRVGGPITPMQLQLMVNSGMLEAHHRIRREDSAAWSVAGSVRGLFLEPARPEAQVPRAMPVAAVAQAPAAVSSIGASTPVENPFAGFSAGLSQPGPAPNAFDFFSAATPAYEMPESVAGGPAAMPAHAPPRPIGGPVSSSEAEDNPFAFANDSAGANGARSTAPSTAEIQLSDDPPLGFANEPGSGSDLKPVAPPRVADGTPSPDVAPTQQRTPPAVVPEVSGKAVELVAEHQLNVLEGRTSFRLYRNWLHVVTKFGDGTIRTTYLRFPQIDGAVLEHRYESARPTKAPLGVLSFSAGAMTVALAFSGSEKAYRAFAEKVLNQGLPPRGGPAKG